MVISPGTANSKAVDKGVCYLQIRDNILSISDRSRASCVSPDENSEPELIATISKEKGGFLYSNSESLNRPKYKALEVKKVVKISKLEFEVAVLLK